MEKLEDEQIKERAEYNVGHDSITIDMDINIDFSFHIYKGRLFWVEDKQKIFVERFRTIPGEKGGELVFTAKYDENRAAKECICELVNDALGDPVVKNTIAKYIKGLNVSNHTDESIYGKYDYLSQIFEASEAKNIKTRDMEHEDSLIQTIIKSGGDYYIIVDKESTPGHYKAVQVFDGSSKSFLIKKINDLDLSSGNFEDGESDFKEIASKSANKIFNSNGDNSFNAIDSFKLECLTRFDSLNDKPAEAIIEKEPDESGVESSESAENKGIDTTSDDIYNGKGIDEYPNIRELGKFKNEKGEFLDITFKLTVTSLEISHTFGWESTPTFTITKNMVKNTCLDYREAKKVNLYINGINRRPKDATKFLEKMLPFFVLEFKNIQHDKNIKGGKYKGNNNNNNNTNAPTPAAPASGTASASPAPASGATPAPAASTAPTGGTAPTAP